MIANHCTQLKLTESINGTVQLHVSILAIHIVSSTSRIVFNPDAIVLDISVVLLSDLGKLYKFGDIELMPVSPRSHQESHRWFSSFFSFGA